MNKEQKFYETLQDVFIGTKIEGEVRTPYPPSIDTILQKRNIDIAKTLSNLTGKWIKKIRDGEVEFEDGTTINTEHLDYKLIKPLIWWE